MLVTSSQSQKLGFYLHFGKKQHTCVQKLVSEVCSEPVSCGIKMVYMKIPKQELTNKVHTCIRFPPGGF